IDGGVRLELAGLDDLCDVGGLAEGLFGAGVNLVHVVDGRAGLSRVAAVRDGAVVGVLFVAREPVEASRDWLAGRFAEPVLPASEAVALLAGRPAGARADPGRRVCTCYGIGVNQIRAAVLDGCSTVEAVGDRLKAGTNCGSCRPEIVRIVADTLAEIPPAEAAE
ncbi:MAG: nitrate reductase, partial [Phyllobacteriaceae bacterium]|nr:nitrate reductase [Phyllobacteriaceae bacterium]